MSFLVCVLSISLGSSLAINGILYWLLGCSKKVQNSALESVAEVANYVGDSFKKSEKLEDLKELLTSEKMKDVVINVTGKNKAIKSTQRALLSLWLKGKAKIAKF